MANDWISEVKRVLGLITVGSLLMWLPALLYYLQPVREVGGPKVLAILVAAAVAHLVGLALAWAVWGHGAYWTDDVAQRWSSLTGWVALLSGVVWCFQQILWLRFGGSLWLLAAAAFVLWMVTVASPFSVFAPLRRRGGLALAAVVGVGTLALVLTQPQAPLIIAPAVWCASFAVISSALARQIA